MSEFDKEQLKHAVEHRHGGTATFSQAVPVSERSGGVLVWRGVVYVFDLQGHPEATRAYAWASPVQGSAERRFFTALHISPVDSPVAAVRAAIMQEHRISQEEPAEPDDHSEHGGEA